MASATIRSEFVPVAGSTGERPVVGIGADVWAGVGTGPPEASDVLVVAPPALPVAAVEVGAVVDAAVDATEVVDSIVVVGAVVVVVVDVVVVVVVVVVAHDSDNEAPRLAMPSLPIRTETDTVLPSTMDPDPWVVAPAVSSTPVRTSCPDPESTMRSLPGWTDPLFSPV